MNLAFNENQRRDINYVSPYSYWDSYINITYYPAILSFAKYNEKLAAHKDGLREVFSSENEKLQKWTVCILRRPTYFIGATKDER